MDTEKKDPVLTEFSGHKNKDLSEQDAALSSSDSGDETPLQFTEHEGNRAASSTTAAAHSSSLVDTADINEITAAELLQSSRRNVSTKRVCSSRLRAHFSSV